MMRCTKSLFWFAAVLAALAMGCSGDDNDGEPSGECGPVGQACSLHDPCAINPTCSAQGECVAQGYQQCDDGLDCTDDICAGRGKCDFVPREGFCALSVKGADGKSATQCFRQEDRHPEDPCRLCDTEKDKLSWSSANGGACNDGDDCTKDDYCDNGVCKGTYYGQICQDEFSCTEDLCDGRGGCLGNKLRDDACLINGECYQDQQTDEDQCNVCDVSNSRSEWTPLTEHCLIDGKCYQPDETDDTGCGICKPELNDKDWTLVDNVCKIDDECVQAGAKNVSAGSCGECVPETNAEGWTVVGDFCLIDDDCKSPGETNNNDCAECDPDGTGGKYDWTPLPDRCLIGDACYETNKEHPDGPCAKCDPNADPNGWTATGTGCFIAGQCEDAGAPSPDGCGTCQPANPYDWTPVTDKCFIDGKCYDPGTPNRPTDPCATCQPSESNTNWTVTGDNCLVGGECYDPGQGDSSGCGTCQPAQNKYAFTPLSNQCRIGQQCYSDQEQDDTTCLKCVVGTDPDAWSPNGTTTLVHYDFESGAATGWQINNSDAAVGWSVVSRRPGNGSYSLYYGDPAAGNYDSGDQNIGSALSPAFTLAANKTAGLRFWLYMDVEANKLWDIVRLVLVEGSNTSELWRKSLDSTAIYSTFDQWYEIYIDLTPHAGKTVQLRFEFDSFDGLTNTSEGVFVDDITIFGGC